MTTMQAAVLRQFGQPLSIENIGGPDPGRGQVLVRVHYSGFCRKQLEEMAGTRPDPYLPHLLGHEGSGVVVAIGPEVTTVSEGQHVVLTWIKGTGIQSDTPSYRSGSEAINAGWVTTFNEYVVAAENRVVAVRDDMPLESAALLGCAVPTGAGSIMNDDAVRAGTSVVIFGTGGIGLNAIQAASVKGADPVIAVDIHDEKLKMARGFGATHTINASDVDPVAAVKDLTDGEGALFTFESAGLIKTMEQAYEAASDTRGKVVLAGVNPASEKLCIDPHALHFGKVLAGTAGGFSQPDEDIPRYIDMYLDGRWKLDELITHRFSLEEINIAADALRSGVVGRAIIKLI
jgi:S-(hydroxymethyl)glutathione dehydrogenase/alcohol dehydrogenase